MWVVISMFVSLVSMDAREIPGRSRVDDTSFERSTVRVPWSVRQVCPVCKGSPFSSPQRVSEKVVTAIGVGVGCCTCWWVYVSRVAVRIVSVAAEPVVNVASPINTTATSVVSAVCTAVTDRVGGLGKVGCW